ncbi:MAG: dTMP kinase, partial [Acidimicrobiales bacterium]
MSPARLGRLIALEGIDGSGKSTQAPLLAASLGALLTFEPGATALGRELRRLLVSAPSPRPDGDGDAWGEDGDAWGEDGDGGDDGDCGEPRAPSARTEALIVAADRSQHVEEVIRPALAAGRWVVTDRFSGSTLAYQGFGQGLDTFELSTLSNWAAGGVVADLSIVLDVPLALARSRLSELDPDRIEQFDEAFF